MRTPSNLFTHSHSLLFTFSRKSPLTILLFSHLVSRLFASIYLDVKYWSLQPENAKSGLISKVFILNFYCLSLSVFCLANSYLRNLPMGEHVVHKKYEKKNNKKISRHAFFDYETLHDWHSPKAPHPTISGKAPWAKSFKALSWSFVLCKSTKFQTFLLQTWKQTPFWHFDGRASGLRQKNSCNKNKSSFLWVT